MNDDKETRGYHSSVREKQSLDTRDRILDAVRDLMISDPEQAFSIEDVARAAGVNRRTVFRHFPDKGQLIDAFWSRTNQGLGVRFWPQNEDDLLRLPVGLFEALDSVMGVIRAAHYSAAGREMLMRANLERRAAFEKSLEKITAGMNDLQARQIQASVQLLFSATALQTMRDYWGLSATEAGNAAAWTIKAILKAAREESRGAEAGTPQESSDRTAETAP